MSSFPAPVESEDVYDKIQEAKVADTGRKVLENFSYNSAADFDKHSSNLQSNYTLNGREESGANSGSLDKDDINQIEKDGVDA